MTKLNEMKKITLGIDISYLAEKTKSRSMGELLRKIRDRFLIDDKGHYIESYYNSYTQGGRVYFREAVLGRETPTFDEDLWSNYRLI